jgi:hypothetical protein
VGAENVAIFITAIVTIFAERKFRRTQENVNRHCNYLLYYGNQAPYYFNMSAYRRYEYWKISDIHNPGLYSWAVGIKNCFSDNKTHKKEMTNKYVMKIYSQ